MAGSMRWYKYNDDDDTDYGVLLDETTGSTAALGFTPVATGDEVTQLPRGVKMRWINCTKMSGGGGEGFVQAQFPVGSTNATAWTTKQLTLTVGSSTYVKTSSRGEQVRIVIATNTGQTGVTP